MAPVPVKEVLILLSIFFILSVPADSVEESIRDSLVRFMDKLSPQRDSTRGWNLTSDPCLDQWTGVRCDFRSQFIRKIVLEEVNLGGTFDTGSLCEAKSLKVLSLSRNNVGGNLGEEISNCNLLTHLYLGGNKLSGKLPGSLYRLGNLKRLDISGNSFNGELPDLARISGMISFLAQDNRLTGRLPEFDFTNFEDFNVSNNNFQGQIPDVKGHFTANSFLGNPDLCGSPLSNACLPSEMKSKHWSVNRLLIFSGYVLLGLIIVLFVIFKVYRWIRRKEGKIDGAVKSERSTESSLGSSKNKTNITSSEPKNSEYRSEYSITSVESGMTTSSLVVLNGLEAVHDLRFEDLLRAPAELLGRGKHGTLYKVNLSSGVVLAVKRIRDWGIPCSDFTSRMEKIDRVKHPNVLPPIAFYCSSQEKLLVYEYQPNGNLFGLLHGDKNDQILDWGSRVLVAASIAKALAFMHEVFRVDQIAHGNLKSTNILFDKDMDPCISEYGLMVAEDYRDHRPNLSGPQASADKSLNQDGSYSPFEVDIYSFGVILLELLTGKTVQTNGYDLARWVHTVVREEWTVEVFDRVLIQEGASEDRMVSMLQVALQCINPSGERPSMRQVSTMVNQIREAEDSSLLSCEP